MAEQRKIVKNLPDGVLICKQVVQRPETLGNDFSQMVLPEPTMNQVKFYNKTFQALFGLEIDFEQANQIQSPLIIKSTNQYDGTDDKIQKKNEFESGAAAEAD